jgi:hypothetical protein
MWNLIIDGKVTEQFENRPVIHPSLLLVEGSASAGYLYDGTSFSEPPPAPTLSYQKLRAREYPPVADYLDGIVKADDLQVQKYIDECLAVKAKYPKGND